MDDELVDTVARVIYNVAFITPAWEDADFYAKGTAILQARQAIVACAAHLARKANTTASPPTEEHPPGSPLAA